MYAEALRSPYAPPAVRIEIAEDEAYDAIDFPIARPPASSSFAAARDDENSPLGGFVRALAAVRDADDLPGLAALDAMGFLAGPGESFAAYRERGRVLIDGLRALQLPPNDPDATLLLDNGRLELQDADRLTPEVIAEASAVTDGLYGFRLEWAPAFFSRQRVGPLWAGCAFGDPATGASVLLLRDEFRRRERWGIYDRREISAHELCHVARQAFGDADRLEEFHAYRTSRQPLRRYLGNCFESIVDAYVFVAPALATAVVQTARVVFELPWPMWPWWTATAAAPLYLLVKNHFARRRYFNAAEALRRAGWGRPEPLLFRTAWEELPALTAAARSGPAGLADFFARNSDIRRRVASYRFAPGGDGSAGRSGLV